MVTLSREGQEAGNWEQWRVIICFIILISVTHITHLISQNSKSIGETDMSHFYNLNTSSCWWLKNSLHCGVILYLLRKHVKHLYWCTAHDFFGCLDTWHRLKCVCMCVCACMHVCVSTKAHISMWNCSTYMRSFAPDWRANIFQCVDNTTSVDVQGVFLCASGPIKALYRGDTLYFSICSQM